MRASALLMKNNNPTRAEVVKSLSLNMCRCTGYMKIIDAVLDAAKHLRSNAPPDVQPFVEGPMVGQSVPRLDSPDTVTGAAKYAADLKMDGMLHAKLLRSPHHHARNPVDRYIRGEGAAGRGSGHHRGRCSRHALPAELPASSLRVSEGQSAVPR